jgi:hypothetical protein
VRNSYPPATTLSFEAQSVIRKKLIESFLTGPHNLNPNNQRARTGEMFGPYMRRLWQSNHRRNLLNSYNPWNALKLSRSVRECVFPVFHTLRSQLDERTGPSRARLARKNLRRLLDRSQNCFVSFLFPILRYDRSFHLLITARSSSFQISISSFGAHFFIAMCGVAALRAATRVRLA